MRKRILIIGITLVALIAISVCFTLYILEKNNKPGSTGQADQATMQTKEDTPTIDYSGLDAVLKEVPDYYNVLFDDTLASHLGELLDYVNVNKEKMTQETVDYYAYQIQEILKKIDSNTDVVKVYIKVNDGMWIYPEYTSAAIAIIDSRDGKDEQILDSSAVIKVRGNSSTEVPKKSYTIKFSEKEDVLGMGKAKKWVLTANAFDKSLMRNKLVYDFASEIGLKYTPESEYADVWLNGRFVGNYLLSEVIEASPSRVDIDTDKGDFLIEREVERVSEGTKYFKTPNLALRFGVNEPSDITFDQLTELRDFLGKVEKALQTRDWETLTDYVDEKSYIDFYILSELFKVVDFDYSSTRFYIKNGKLYAGPSWDNDLSSGNADSEFYYEYNYNEGYGPDTSYIGLWCRGNFYSYCSEMPEFEEALHARYQELQDKITNLYEDNSLGKNQIDVLLEKYGKSFERNYTTAGWTLTQDFILERIPEPTFEENVEYLRGWLEKRNEFLLDSFH